MPINTENLNKKLYDLLKTQGVNPIPKDSENKTTPVPDEAEVMQITVDVGSGETASAWVTIDGNRKLVLYYDDGVADESNQNWDKLRQVLKSWAMRKGQISFELKNKDHLANDMAQRSHMKKKEQIAEGYHPMGKSASYNDNIPTVKIVLQHTRQIQEGEQRYRNVAKIFLENQQGERILCPSTKPGIAQIYARHLAEGGLPHDERWNHIGSLVEEYSRMAGFVRATRSGQFNESAQQLVNEGINHYNSLRETLGKMRGHRGYQAYFENYTPALMETEGDESINELFVQETMDPRIESVMPILARLHKKVNEMSEVSELAEWADKLIEGDGGQEALNPIGIPEEDLTEQLGDVRDQEDFQQRMKVIQQYQMTQRADPKRSLAKIKQALIQKAKAKGLDTSKYELEEDLGPEQKAVGQLGPNSDHAKEGDLVGEGTYNKDVERAFPNGKASGVKTGASAPKGTSTMPKDKEKAKGKPVGVEEGIVDKIRAMNYDRLARRSFDKADDEFDKMDDFAFSNVDTREPYEKEFSRHVDKMQSRRNKAAALRGKPQDVAEGSGKNVVKSVKVGNFRHDLVDTGMGWQVRIYNGDELYDTGLSKNSEQKGLAALEDAVAYTEKQTRTKRQGVSEGRKLYKQEGSLEKWTKDAEAAGHKVVHHDGRKDPNSTHHAINKDGKVVGKFFNATYVNNKRGFLHQQGVVEGKFTVNAKTGAKLDPRTGAELPPKEKPVTMKQMFAPNAKVATPKLTLSDVWRKVEEVVGQIYPDGDPIDWLLPWFKKQGIADHKVGDILARAAQKNGYKDIYDYYNSFADDLGLSEDHNDSIGNPMYDAVCSRFMRHPEGLKLLQQFGPETVMSAIDDVTDGWEGEEIGTSDVSAYFKRAAELLQGSHSEPWTSPNSPDNYVPDYEPQKGWTSPKIAEGQEDLDAIRRMLGEGIKGEIAGGTVGGLVGGMAGGAALGPVGTAIGGALGSATGSAIGGRWEDEKPLKEREQLDEFAPLIAAGARMLVPLLARVGPALGRMAAGAGKATANVAGKAATGVGRGAVEVGKSAAQSAAQNAGKIGLGVGAYQAITDVANSMVGGVGQVYNDIGSAASEIAKVVGGAIDNATIRSLAEAAVKYAIPIGILLAVVYGGKKLIDKVMSEGVDDTLLGRAGQTVGAFVPNPVDFAKTFEGVNKGQEDLDAILRIIRK